MNDTQIPSSTTKYQDPINEPEHPAHNLSELHPSGGLPPQTDAFDGSDEFSVESRLTQRAPDGKRCFITLDVEPLWPCHLVPHSITAETRRNLEYSWGVKAGELQLNNPSNLLWLRPDMHKRFNNRDWALVPTLEVLQGIIFHDTLRSGKPGTSHYATKFPKQTWNYHFVPLRRSPIVFERFKEDHGVYTLYDYPFESLGELRSHVHPFFAIYDAGEKVRYHNYKKSQQPELNYHLPLGFDDHLRYCLELFLSWDRSMSDDLDIPIAPRPPRPRLSHHPGASSRRSGQRPQQMQELTERAQRRNNNSKIYPPPPSGSGAGIPQGNKHKTTTSKGDGHLPTLTSSSKPAHSQRTTYRDRQPATMRPGTTSPTRHWTSVSDWIAGVESSGLCEDPNEGGTEDAEQSVVQYNKYEPARPHPWGPWEEWIPEYKII